MSPMVSAEPIEGSESVVIDVTPVFADLDDFEEMDSHPYMLPDSDEMLYSATRMMKNHWISEGMPGVEIATSPQSVTSGRALRRTMKVIQQLFLLQAVLLMSQSKRQLQQQHSWCNLVELSLLQC